MKLNRIQNFFPPSYISKKKCKVTDISDLMHCRILVTGRISSMYIYYTFVFIVLLNDTFKTLQMMNVIFYFTLIYYFSHFLLIFFYFPY